MSATLSSRARTHLVIDTTVWLSAAISDSGAPAALVQRALAQGIVIFSDATFAELETRLWKSKFDRYTTLDGRRAILRGIKASAVWATIPDAISAQKYCRDVDDDKFIHLALAAAALWLITGDQDLLVIDHELPITIMSPANALRTPHFLVE